MATSTKKACLHTLGCRLNQAETALIAEKLAEAGYVVVPFGEQADLGIINTCTVTRDADAKSRKLIRGFIRKNPGAYTAVIGCYSQTGYKELADISGVDLIVGNQEKLNVLHYVAAGRNATPLIVRDHIERDDFTIDISGGVPAIQRANLKIQDGCNFMCSFCIIPFARGRARSRAMDNLLDEARVLVGRGAHELVLTGVNIGTYAYQDMSIVDIVERLNALDGVDRIRISSIEPTTIPESLLDAMNDPAHALVPHLHIPLQAGADTVLAVMKRKYTRQEFIDFVEMAADKVPDLCVGTDVLVGFPGETDEDFEQTCRLLEESPVTYAHVFKYSEREGTASVRLSGKTPPDVMNARSARLRRIADRKRRLFLEKHVGRVLDVLFENAESGHWFGYTGNYVRVCARSEDDLANTIRPVRLDRYSGDVMTGTVVHEH
jgi:threonylcarbamoyladenosine tRNA methylthiotransferase MtaB